MAPHSSIGKLLAISVPNSQRCSQLELYRQKIFQKVFQDKSCRKGLSMNQDTLYLCCRYQHTSLRKRTVFLRNDIAGEPQLSAQFVPREAEMVGRGCVSGKTVPCVSSS
uniref:Uncharacterized protein n=1 Tax=Lotus japonicus TaxID=34305 RepID=I3S309_LOTJA|nr:unknown [Lotus japonicus]